MMTSGPSGTTVKVTNAGMNEIRGARMNSTLCASDGMMSSLKNSLSTSAAG